jgi:hypothetical protein
MIRFLRYSAVCLVSALVGAPLGYLLGHRSMGEGSKIFSHVYALGEYETLAGLQYKEARSPQGRQALLNLLDFMKHLETHQTNTTGTTIELDRDIAYARLALLEEREGNRDSSQTYMQKALEGMARRSKTEYSEAHLRDQVSKLDSKYHYAFPGVFSFRQAKN